MLSVDYEKPLFLLFVCLSSDRDTSIYFVLVILCYFLKIFFSDWKNMSTKRR